MRPVYRPRELFLPPLLRLHAPAPHARRWPPRFPLIGALDGDLTGLLGSLLALVPPPRLRAGHHGPRLPRESRPISASASDPPAPQAAFLAPRSRRRPDRRLRRRFPTSAPFIPTPATSSCRVRESGFGSLRRPLTPPISFSTTFPGNSSSAASSSFPSPSPRRGKARARPPRSSAALVLFQTIPSTLLHFGHPLSELASAVAGWPHLRRSSPGRPDRSCRASSSMPPWDSAPTLSSSLKERGFL